MQVTYTPGPDNKEAVTVQVHFPADYTDVERKAFMAALTPHFHIVTRQLFSLMRHNTRKV